ncbi:2157_t:CDS:2 [Racocetra fulgida]|uniref:2157_t:CDS:1 n=1 Tax=Racocetra fulgida TaxID=60492 RepID=A0A9N8ZM75_9GLOM|nr:2157_t:CDS:2 [Racocetra fulgida]
MQMAQHYFLSSDSHCYTDIKQNEQEVAIKYLIRKNTPQANRDFTREVSRNNIYKRVELKYDNKAI